MSEATTILVVDDDEDDRLLAAEAARRAGIGAAVHFAVDGPSALARLDDDGSIGLVLLDLQLPGMTGLETLRAIRSGRRPTIPVVVLSTSSSAGHIEQAHAAGANAFLVKASALADSVRQFVAIRLFWLRAAALPAADVDRVGGAHAR